MNRLFSIPRPFQVPDGTLVSPFLNSRDNQSGLPFDLLSGFSIAAGTILPGTKSKIHKMPFVTQVVFVRRGTLNVIMSHDAKTAPYPLTVQENHAALVERATLLQLENNGSRPCEVLYVVSPPYVFEKTGERVSYDDSVVTDQDWSDINAAGWQPVMPDPTIEEREATEARLRQGTRR